jgi:hypothetical protein
MPLIDHKLNTGTIQNIASLRLQMQVVSKYVEDYCSDKDQIRAPVLMSD